MIGTHTANGAQNYLQIANVEIPKNISPNAHGFDEDTGEIGGFGDSASDEQAAIEMHIEQKIDHPGEVNKARYQPQNPNIIATMCVDGRVLIFDRTKHSSFPKGVVTPQAELLGHKKEGFGLSWNPHEAGHLATGSEDKTVRLWYAHFSSNYIPSLRLLGTSIRCNPIILRLRLRASTLTMHPLSMMCNTTHCIRL